MEWPDKDRGKTLTTVSIRIEIAKYVPPTGLMPCSLQSLNMFKRCLVKHGLKLFSL